MDAKNIADAFLYKNIISAGVSTIKTGIGILHSITLNTVAATSGVVIYDNTTNSGTIIGTITSTAGQGTFLFDCLFVNGLTIAVAGTPDITVNYK